jgi:pimeloyl-ACP methyl ester carboxylesterase
MTQDLMEYSTAKNITKCYLLGHSMGGKLAMFFATKHPNMIEKLIIADIAPKFYPPHHDDILDGLQAIDFDKKPSRVAVDEILSAHIPDFGTRQFLLKNLYWQTPGQLAFRFNLPAFLKNKSSVGEALPLDAIFTKPTLFISGGASNYVTVEDVAPIKTHFPLAVIETIPNVGHWLHAENPAAFLKISLEFLIL